MSLIKQAVAAALITAAATSAYAVDVSNYNADSTVTNVYVSGSTAANIVLWQSFVHTTAGGITAICDATAGTIDVYSDAADTKNPAAQLFIYCKANAAVGVPGNVALFKESTLGSVNGSKPLITIAKAGSGNANTLAFVNASTLADSNCAAATQGTLAGSQTYTFHGSCTFPTQVPHVVITGGISDVEAPLVGTNPSDVTNFLTGAPGLAVVWAVPVNKPFYRALQTGQGLANTDAPATVPSLTRAQIAAIYSQQIVDPSKIIGGSGAIASSSTIGICRREFGSGTEASAELHWLGEGCATTDLSIPAGDNSNVFENTSTGKIGACLTALDLGGTINGQPVPAAGRFAIGIVSSENGPSLFGPNPSTPASDDVRVIAVDGALPTLENVANGSYPFFSEDVLYNISSSLYTGNPKKVWDAVKANFGAPGFLADSNKAFANYWGQSGDMSPPSIYGAPATVPATATSVKSSPINNLTKSTSGSPNNCDPAVVFDKTATYQFLNN